MRWALEIDDSAYHIDVVADMGREIYLCMRGRRLMRFPVAQLWNDPDRVYREVLKYIMA